jgi:DNA-binding LytR/AlgR family response regulator
MSISCIITDDEPIARKGLQGYVEKINYLKLEAVCEDAVQLSNTLQTTHTDLLLLDIEMPYLSGVDFIKSLSNPPKVIFTTAYENYAIQGFELDVLDYLLKPISFERFLKAAGKAADYFNSRNSTRDFMFVKVDKRLEKIVFAEILFLEAMQNYVSIQTQTKKLLVHTTLKSIQAELPASLFIQTHKSFIVNLNAVSAVEGNLLHCGSYRIPVSKNEKEQILEKIINKGK